MPSYPKNTDILDQQLHEDEDVPVAQGEGNTTFKMECNRNKRMYEPDLLEEIIVENPPKQQKVTHTFEAEIPQNPQR